MNVITSVVGGILTIKIDLNFKDGGLSASGKSRMLATTSGTRPIEGMPHIKLGLNCFIPQK
jgi:hypothetical protein